MESAQSKIQSWKQNPIKFVHDCFKVDPDEWQKDALMALIKPGSRKRIVLKACTGPGKSAVLAWAGWYRLACYAGKGEHPKGAALSGQGANNLADNLWAELSKWQSRSDFLKAAFEWTKTRIYARDHAETWFLSARSYPKAADNESIGQSLSGLHSNFPFILLDETGEMPLTVGQKAEQIFTGGCLDGLIMQAGNPTSSSGLLYHSSINDGDRATVITITADPDDPKRTPRVDIEHAREQIKKYGRDNPWVMATILGEFPPGGLNQLLSVQEVEQAMGKHLRKDAYCYSQKRLGIDVARFGDDRTIIFPRQGLAAFKYIEMRNARTNDIAAKVMYSKQKWGSEHELVDGTGGYGAGVIDAMIQQGNSPHEIHFSGKALDPRYFNKRAEMWFEMAEWVKRGGALPTCNNLKKELLAPTYSFKNGKFFLEPKDQIKDRLGYSPDIADALCLTFALPEMPITSYDEHLKNQYSTGGNLKHEYDPLKDI